MQGSRWQAAAPLIKEGGSMTDKQAWAVEQLQTAAAALGRLPKKEDFDEATRSRIKAYLGPWPRALEAAGLKEPRPKPVKSRKRRPKPTHQRRDEP